MNIYKLTGLLLLALCMAASAGCGSDKASRDRDQSDKDTGVSEDAGDSSDLDTSGDQDDGGLRQEDTGTNAATTYLEELETACLKSCTQPINCTLAENEDAGIDEETLENIISGCTDQCVTANGSFMSAECTEATIAIISCVGNLDCDETVEVCEQERTVQTTACDPMTIYGDRCQTVCDHLDECQLEGEQVCLGECVEGLADSYWASLECGEAYEDWTNCLVELGCAELVGFAGPSTSGPCGAEYSVVETRCTP